MQSAFGDLRNLRADMRQYGSMSANVNRESPRTPMDNFRDYLEVAKARENDNFKLSIDDRQYLRRHMHFLRKEHDVLVENTLGNMGTSRFTGEDGGDTEDSTTGESNTDYDDAGNNGTNNV